MQNNAKKPNIPENFSGKRAALMDWITKQIYSGNYKPGDIIPSRHSLIESFGCSYATVDYVLRALIKEGVITAERGKATYVAEPEKIVTNNAIAVINFNPVFFWSEEVLDGIRAEIGNREKVDSFSIFDIRIPKTWQNCKSYKCVVLLFPDAQHTNFLEELQVAHIPHLVLYRDPPESSFISIDFRASGKALVDALKIEGCRKLAWTGWIQNRYKSPEQKYEGFLEGLLSNGLIFKKDWVSFSEADEEKFIRSLFSTSEKPDALVMSNDSIDNVVTIIREIGLEPGRDIKLACMDEIAPGKFPFPIMCMQKLTTEIGREAGKILSDETLYTSKLLFQRYLYPKVIKQ